MIFTASREFPTNMLPVSFMPTAVGMLFRCSQTLQELGLPVPLSLQRIDDQEGEHFEAMVYDLNKEHKEIYHNDMSIIFPGWPSNVVEEWAVDYNNSFMLKFDVFYMPPTMNSSLYVKAFGISNVDWPEYQDTYKQAITMEKLRSNI